MPESLHALLPLVVLLSAGVLSATLLPRFGVPALLGYIAAGLLVGPSFTGWVSMTETVMLLAEFGVIFLMFDIGLHFSLRQLWRMRADFLGLGPLQWLSTAAVIACMLWLMDLPLMTLALPVAGTLALSSTAVALQTIQERGGRGTPLESKATALLVFQDVVAVVLLAIVGAQGGGSEGTAPVSWALAKAALAIAAVALIGRLLRPAFAFVVGVGVAEAFTATALLVVVATAGITGMAGLSLPIGAFLGGMLLSESEYCYMLKTELKPFRGLLLGLFFITVGMSIEADVVLDAFWVTCAIALALLAVKGVLVGLAARLTGATWALSVRMGCSLAQGSEFAFVIFGIMAASGSLPGGMAAVLVAAVVISMAFTPVLAPLGDRLASWVDSRSTAPELDKSNQLESHNVLINGAGDTQLTVASALLATGHDYLIVDTDRPAIRRARSLGFAASFGDLDDARLVATLAERADIFIMGKTSAERALPTVRQLRQRRPQLAIIARVVSETEALELRASGVTVCVSTDDPDDLTLALETLRYLSVDDTEIQRWAGQFDRNPEWERADKAHAA